ncbi:SDR family NAD(P)-dependent oxidoreductase [Halopseudomonas pelagia]|uniref:SDR family NAD(P)-dependent oxidoreductase n=1 Tax=Halopseudomonas pelagia TaxID=553151 RepID=UPI0030D7F7BF|tara:strand:- start:446 stop:1204 length:759 start_codon:yes stop_codon:yes gene_type:complete
MDLAFEQGRPASIVIAGASRGIGWALVQQLLLRDDVGQIFALARHTPEGGWPDDVRLIPLLGDLTEELVLDTLAASVSGRCDRLDMLINTVGFLHEDQGQQPEKSLRQVSLSALQRSFTINAGIPILLAKAFLPLLRGKHRCVFASLSARVGSIGDNRLGGWYAYRASKAAQNMLMRTFAVEWQRLNRKGVCLLLHPGTTDTELSRPFQANVPEAKLFTADFVAERLLAVIAERGPEDSGQFYAWDGRVIPW